MIGFVGVLYDLVVVVVFCVLQIVWIIVVYGKIVVDDGCIVIMDMVLVIEIYNWLSFKFVEGV